MPKHTPSPAAARSTTGRWLLAGWHLVQAGVLLYGLGTSGYVLARIAAGERWNVVAFANNFVPWWALGGAAAACVGLVPRRRWLLVPPNVPVIVLFVASYGPMLLPHASGAGTSGAPTLIAATYNIKASQSDPARVLDVIAGLDADIVGLQELGPDHAARLDETLAERYPYRVLVPELPTAGVGLLSRWPVVDHTVFRPLPDSMFSLRAVLDVGGVPVTVYVVHPSPPRNVLLPVTYDDDRRNTEIAILRGEYLLAERGPVIVLGDFNMSDQSTPYHQMTALLSDAFREAGRGLGFSFPDVGRGMPPLLRIDYVWHSAQFAALDARAGTDSGTSDHRPVIATLALKPEFAGQPEG